MHRSKQISKSIPENTGCLAHGNACLRCECTYRSFEHPALSTYLQLCMLQRAVSLLICFDMIGMA